MLCHQKTHTLKTNRNPSPFLPQKMHSTQQSWQLSEELWHCSNTAKTLLCFYVLTSDNVRDSRAEFVFPCFLNVQCFSELCASRHTSAGARVHAHTHSQPATRAGSKASSITNPPSGKHSSRYCGTLPAAYCRLSLTWESFLMAISLGERHKLCMFHCPLHFDAFSATARCRARPRQLLHRRQPLCLPDLARPGTLAEASLYNFMFQSGSAHILIHWYACTQSCEGSVDTNIPLALWV